MSKRSDDKDRAEYLSNLESQCARSWNEGYADAKQYRTRRAAWTDEWQYLMWRPLLAGHDVARWAYDAGYDAGVKERDAYEARRDEARSKRQWATGGPVRVTTWQIGENGPVSFVPNEAPATTTEESNDE